MKLELVNTPLPSPYRAEKRRANESGTLLDNAVTLERDYPQREESHRDQMPGYHRNKYRKIARHDKKASSPTDGEKTLRIVV